jgi:hypothetical protein
MTTDIQPELDIDELLELWDSPLEVPITKRTAYEAIEREYTGHRAGDIVDGTYLD